MSNSRSCVLFRLACCALLEKLRYIRQSLAAMTHPTYPFVRLEAKLQARDRAWTDRWLVAALLCASTLLGCAGAGQSSLPGPSVGDLAYDAFECPDVPTAYVYGRPSGPAGQWLAAAGFDVQALTDQESPNLLRGLLVFPTDSAQDPAYGEYVQQHSEELYEFVDGANVLLQLAVDPVLEPEPVFFPTTQQATRVAGDIPLAYAADPDHLLLQGVLNETNGFALQSTPAAQSYFPSYRGFGTVVAGANQEALLLEGAYGQGRFLVTTMALDQLEDDAAANGLAANLVEYVQAVCERAVAESSMDLLGPPQVLTPESELLAVLPDTQVYSESVPALFDAQTLWIRRNAERFGIRYVIHLGDIVNSNTALEWERAALSMSLLDGVVSYALVPGNHDYGPSGNAATRDTLLNDYFPFAQVTSQPGFGGAYVEGALDNSYHLLEVGGRSLIVIALEWGPRDEVIAWANEVMAEHPDREGILVTHAYLNHNNRRYDHTDTVYPQRFNPHEYATPGGVNDGEELWQKLVRHHRFIMVLNGHVLEDGEGYLASVTDLGNTCHQMLSNYQMRENGGEAYMRLLEFMPDGTTVRVHTYSPLYDTFLQEPGQNFSFTLE